MDRENLTGQLLLAIPDLPDTNFYRSVVLLLQHSEEGATGVILNRPSNITVSTVWDEVSEEEACNSTERIHVGGPVEGPLIALHTAPQWSESTVIPGVYMAMRRENLNALVNQDQYPYRVFSGYSGWGAGQLEGEIEQGGWLIADASRDVVFGPLDNLWRERCEAVGRSIMIPRRSPQSGDPSWN